MLRPVANKNSRIKIQSSWAVKRIRATIRALVKFGTVFVWNIGGAIRTNVAYLFKNKILINKKLILRQLKKYLLAWDEYITRTKKAKHVE